MKLQQFKFLTDENIHPEVVDFLVNPPFIIVAERTGEQIKIRIRNL